MVSHDVQISSEYGWFFYKEHWGSVWVKGYIYGFPDLKVAAKKLFHIIETSNHEEIKNFLVEVDGHFSIVIETAEMLFAAVDRIRSIPLFFVDRPDCILLTDQPTRIVHQLSSQESLPALDDKLMLQMSGFCSGNATLFCGLKQLQSGEYLVRSYDKNIKVCSYYSYRPANPDAITEKTELKRNLEVTSTRILQKIIDSAKGRMIVIPLSGGYDSRVVASGLSNLGYKNVKCFSYGHKKNFESSISKMVADKLGYDWKFINLTHYIVREDYQSDMHEDYFSFSNTFASVPVEHEFTAIRHLKESGWISNDAIFVNGMSGDFLTGSHIPKALHEHNNRFDNGTRKDKILSALLDKHYSLWGYLKTPENKKLVADSLWNEIVNEVNGLPESSNDDFGLYEFSEFRNRQTKYVITVQRVYEFFGYEWRLPLWDKEYLDYWEKIQITHKIDRNLFVEVMHDLDWGGVWSLKYPKRYITPKWISLVRFLTKSMFIMFGRENWKKFDKRVFYYWTEILCKMGVVSYFKVLLDNRGYRNAVSWLTENYLDRVEPINRSKKIYC
jgi:asparagine synthase (glutamine-hydrolysing)